MTIFVKCTENSSWIKGFLLVRARLEAKLANPKKSLLFNFHPRQGRRAAARQGRRAASPRRRVEQPWRANPCRHAEQPRRANPRRCRTLQRLGRRPARRPAPHAARRPARRALRRPGRRAAGETSMVESERKEAGYCRAEKRSVESHLTRENRNRLYIDGFFRFANGP